MRLYNRHQDLEKRRTLRRQSTDAEARLWAALRRHALGVNFRRQYGVGAYVLDFYCPAARLAVEVDGRAHDGEIARGNDEVRQHEIESCGITFLRFSNAQVTENLENVVERIQERVEERIREVRSSDLSPGPSP